MSSIIVSYTKYNHNWYVGELYEFFAKELASKFDVSIVPMHELASRYSEPNDTRENGYPSLFNIYNLIVYNTNTNISFVHSLSDHAPVMLDHKSAIEKLGIKAFAFCSNFRSTTEESYKHLGIKLIPSFYILENWDDHNLIEEKNNNKKEIKNKCYFNGSDYGVRSEYIRHLSCSDFFDVRNKHDARFYRNKNQYYDELSKYRYGLSLNGAAGICYRDLECFGLGVLCLREPMDILTKDIILPDKHYKVVVDDFIKSNIYYPNKTTDIIEQLLNNIQSITAEEEKYILHNARDWFLNNSKPNKQIQFLTQSLIENNII